MSVCLDCSISCDFICKSRHILLNKKVFRPENNDGYLLKYLLIHLRSQFIPRLTILAGMPAMITFGSLNSFVTILPQPTILLSAIFTFLPILLSFPIHTCLPISMHLAKLIGSPFKSVIVCASVHHISIPQSRQLSDDQLQSRHA